MTEKQKKKKTILTGYQRHTDQISNGQRVSSNSLPTLLYFLFSPPHIFFNSILWPTHNWHIYKPHKPTHKPKLAKEPILPHAIDTRRHILTILEAK